MSVSGAIKEVIPGSVTSAPEKRKKPKCLADNRT
jgi:hypothetical protein